MASKIIILCTLFFFIPTAIADEYNQTNRVYYSPQNAIEGSQFLQNVGFISQRIVNDTPPANPKKKAYVYGQGNDTIYGYGECNTRTNDLCSSCLHNANESIRTTAPLSIGARLRKNYTSYSCYLRYEWSTFEDLDFIALDVPSNPSPASASSPPPPPPPPPSGGNSLVITIPTVCGGLVLVFIAFLCVKIAKKRRKTDPQQLELHIGEAMVRQFRYSDLSFATKGFSEQEMLGEGGFGKVYKGVLSSDGSTSTVAVKVMSQAHEQGLKQFLAELSVIGQVRHKNLVSLKGWCHERENLILVYEYMQNGSLDQCLSSSDKFLEWSQRFEIVKGVSEGLAYLHGGWERRIVHRDIKPANILLDANFVAHLGDFGLAKLLEDAKFQQSMTMAGTIGYIAPELAYTGKANEKSDIYSFGILLLVIACGRPVLDMALDDLLLFDWIWNAQERDDLLSVVDFRLGNNYDHEQVLLILSLGLICSHPDPESRPSSRRCCLILNGEAPLPHMPSKQPIVNMSYGHSNPNIN